MQSQETTAKLQQQPTSSSASIFFFGDEDVDTIVARAEDGDTNAGAVEGKGQKSSEVAVEDEIVNGRRRDEKQISIALLRKHALLPSVIEACSSEDEIIDKLLALKVLRLPAKGITKMDGLDVVNNLVRLHLQRNRIQQIDGLEFLRGLTWLDLSQNEVRVV